MVYFIMENIIIYFIKLLLTKNFLFNLVIIFFFNKNDTIRFIFKFPLNKLKISRTNAFNIEIPIIINENKIGVWILTFLW